MSKFVVIATNVLTAVVTAAVTSAFWIGAYGENSGDGRWTEPVARAPADASPKLEAAGDKVTVGRPKVEIAEGLVVGPTGLALPVSGIKPRQLVDTFTQARAAGARVHDAIDIMAPRGTPVRAAAPGVVEKLFFSKGGGGITAYVRSDDKRWVYYYAHLDAYAPGLHEGKRLRRGDLIGTVGSTGNASPDGPHLHFAIHRMQPGERWYQGSAINPYPLFAGRTARP